MAGNKLSSLGLILTGIWTASATAEVVRIDVSSRADVAGSAAYAAAGPYEKLRGTLRFAVDPSSPVIKSSPTLRGRRPTRRAESSLGGLLLLKPKDVARGNGALLFEVSNRGRKGILPMMNQAAGSLDPGEARELGDGFLSNSFPLLWVGWQLDPPPGDPLLLRVYPPAAAGVTGFVRSDFVVRTPGVRDYSLGDGDHVAYPADLASDAHTLTVRDEPLGARQTIPRGDWQFARVDGSGNVVVDPTRVYLAGGFTPKRIYEIVYTAANPPLAGLGLAAIRDAVRTRLKHEGAPELGVDAGAFDRALAFGISQSGRVLRTFLYEGFNEDERHRRVFDGVLAHIAGGARGGFNVRFAQPSRSSSSYLYPNEMYPVHGRRANRRRQRSQRRLAAASRTGIRAENFLHQIRPTNIGRVSGADARHGRRPARLGDRSTARASIYSRARSTAPRRFRRASPWAGLPTTRTPTPGSCARWC